MSNKSRITDKIQKLEEEDIESYNLDHSTSTAKKDSTKLIEIPEDMKNNEEYETVKRDISTRYKVGSKAHTMPKKKPKPWV